MSATITRTYPVVCPICGGCGTVPNDFYMRAGVSTSTARETCRSCGGSGKCIGSETIQTPDPFGPAGPPRTWGGTAG